MSGVQRTPSYLPGTWLATILFFFHVPCLFLFVTLSRLPFMEAFLQLFTDKPIADMKTFRWNQLLFFSKVYLQWWTRQIRIGSKFKDVPLVTLDGTKTSIQKYVKDLPLVLNFGSLT